MIYLVSLISEHLLPNFLLAKEFEGKYDRHIFLTTMRMGENSMTSRFCNALKIKKSNVKIIVVSEDDLPDAMRKLKSESFHSNDKFLVNITGGTKVMSIAAYTYFSDFNANFFYIPVCVDKIETLKTGENLPLTYRINVEEYLYGLKFEHSTYLPTEKENYGAIFESQICDRIRREKTLGKPFIYRSVKLFHDDSDILNDNELDIVWTFDNQLFIGECKTSLFKPKEIDNENRLISNPGEYLDEIMYKLSAISKEFGLQVNPYIFIKKELPARFSPARMKSIEKRLKILGIKGLLTGKELRKQKLEV